MRRKCTGGIGKSQLRLSEGWPRELSFFIFIFYYSRVLPPRLVYGRAKPNSDF